ncbi:MAG: hypothetical protein ABI581_08575 [Sediminibacterium sp.]
MKKFLLVPLCLLLLIVIASCSNKMHNSTSYCNAVASGDTVIFLNNQAISLFTSCNNEIQATVTKIMDSRCPKNVTCIWAGTVDVELRLNDQSVIKLPVGKQKDTVLNNRNYSFTLVDVVPYPGSSSDEPKAIVRVIQN